MLDGRSHLFQDPKAQTEQDELRDLQSQVLSSDHMLELLVLFKTCSWSFELVYLAIPQDHSWNLRKHQNGQAFPHGQLCLKHSLSCKFNQSSCRMVFSGSELFALFVAGYLEIYVGIQKCKHDIPPSWCACTTADFITARISDCDMWAFAECPAGHYFVQTSDGPVDASMLQTCHLAEECDRTIAVMGHTCGMIVMFRSSLWSKNLGKCLHKLDQL